MARRPRTSSGPNAVLASARKVRLGTPGVKLDLGLRQEWQKEAWEYWRKVPEVKQLMLFLGNQLGKLRIYVAVEDPDNPDAEPIPITAEKSPVPPDVQVAALAELARLMTHDGGISELLRRLDLNLEIPGEGYLVGYGARTIGETDPRTPIPDKALEVDLPEQWLVVSVSEVLQEGTGALARTAIRQHPGDDVGRRLDAEVDTIIRIYQPDPEWSALADSAMQGILFECRILLALTSQVLAVANSQMFAGILTIPNELSFGPAQPEVTDDDAVPSEDPLERELDDVFMEVVAVPDSLLTIRPTVVRGPNQYLGPDSVRFIQLGRDLDERLDEQINQRVRRIARGLNAPVEAVEGHDATTFANAKQIDSDLFDDHIEPRATGMMQGLSAGFLQPNLIDAGHDEWGPQLFFWYDAAGIIREPDTEAGADSGHRLGTISDDAWRKAKGFAKDDAPDPLELIIRQGLQRGTLDPIITVALLQSIADEAGIELPAADDLTSQGAAGQPSDQMRVLALAMWLRDRRAQPDMPGDGPLVLPAGISGSGSAEVHGPNLGAPLLAIDVELRTRLLVATNDAMERALERAGNRLRAKLTAAQRPLLEGLPPRRFAQVLGGDLVAAAGVDLTAGPDVWGALAPQFDQWVLTAQRDALDQLEGIVGGPLPNRGDLEARQDDDRAAAWAWLLAALGVLLAERLFNPSPDAPALGEHDATMSVPAGYVRAAVARAGGTVELGSASSAAEVGAVLADGGTRPVGGIGDGELMREQFRNLGVAVKAYRWVYGAAHRTTIFRPHLSLDGTVFLSYDDARLSNGTGWPPFGFWLPGDHLGCLCSTELILVPPAGLVPLV